MRGTKRPPWAKTLDAYRLFLYGTGEDRGGGETVDSRAAKEKGFSPGEIREVWTQAGSSR